MAGASDDQVGRDERGDDDATTADDGVPVEAHRVDGSDEVPTRDPTRERPPTPLTQQLGRVVLVVLVVLFTVFALDNSQRVDFSWVFGGTSVQQDVGGGVTGGVPLILLLVAAMLVGAAIGSLLQWQVRRSRRARRQDTGRTRRPADGRD